MASSDPNPSMEARRAALVAELREKGIPLPPPIERAFLTVPRHLFVPGVYLDAVYRDQVIVTKRDKEGVAVSSSSQPAIMAIMLDALEVQEGHRVLEIGAGTGYNAALLAELVGTAGQVTTMEIDDEIAEAAEAHLKRAGYSGVQVIAGDGAAGYPPNAPYDRIICTASVWDLPVAWEEQLRVGGILVTPLSFAGIQLGASLRKLPDGSLESQRLFPLGFISLKGEASGPERAVRVAGSALRVGMSGEIRVDEAQIHTLLSDDHELAQLPLELESHKLGQFSYYLLFHQPADYQFITYQVEEGQMAYGLQGVGWGILSSTSACLLSYGNERVCNVYGGADAYLTLVELAEQWNREGEPGPEQGHLRVTPAGREPYTPPEPAAVRVFVRPTHNYTLWMPRRP